MRVSGYLLTGPAALGDRLRDDDRERGDVPGWVKSTVMTAALVLASLIPFLTRSATRSPTRWTR